MFKNFLRLTVRSFVRDSNYTALNVIGLSIGISACVVIFLLIKHELGFDGFHPDKDRIFRVVMESKSGGGIEHSSNTPYPFPIAFRNDFTDIPKATGLHYEPEVLLNIDGEKVKVKNVLFADSLFFQVFGFPIETGNPEVALGQPGTAFITKSLRDKYFSKEPNSVRLANLTDLKISGVVLDPPANSHIDFSMIVSLPTLTSDMIGGLPLTEWGMTSSGFAYLKLPEGHDAASLEDQLVGFLKKYHSANDATEKRYHLQSLSSIHFDEQYVDSPGDEAVVQKSELLMIGVLGGFIMVIACINFINLSTALSIRKAKEIGIRKTMGAKQTQLTIYFLTEILVLVLIAVVLSLCVCEWLIGWLNAFLDKNLSLHILTDYHLHVFLLILIPTVTLLAGFYPALVLSKFNPAVVLKNKMNAQGSTSARIRKFLVVFQFAIAQVLIIATLIVHQQMDYFRSKPLGFNKEAVITVPMPERNKERRDALRARLEGNQNISALSFAIGPPTAEGNITTGFSRSDAPDQSYRTNVKTVDKQYLETFQLELAAGRWFTESDELAADAKERRFVYVVNETAAKQLGFTKPEDILGHEITTGLNDIKAEVVGVVRDFHTTSLHSEITPVVFLNFPFFYFNASMKIAPEATAQTLQFVEREWTAVFPEQIFEYDFMDQQLEQLYRHEERTFGLFQVLAGLSILIGCLGLYGLISFMAHQRVKEVGIRKVLGATEGSIIYLFSKEFVRLVAIAFLVAAPLSWYFMNEWLQSFAFQTDMGVSPFITGVLATVVIALSTIAYRALRAAYVNPSEILRSE